MNKPLSFQKIVSLSNLLNDEDIGYSYQYSLEQLREYNMNYIGNSENAGFKNILTLSDLNNNETHFRVYSFILSVIHQTHIKKELFKRLFKFPEQLDYYNLHEKDIIGKKTLVNKNHGELLENYLINMNGNAGYDKIHLQDFFNKSDMNYLRENLKACIPVYAQINNYFKNTTFKKITHKINKTQGVDIFLNKYADLFYDYRHNDLKPKYIQLKLIRQLFCNEKEASSNVAPEMAPRRKTLSKMQVMKRNTIKNKQFRAL